MRKWKDLSFDEIAAIWAAYIRTEHSSFSIDVRGADVPMYLTYTDIQYLVDELIKRMKDKDE